MNIKDKKFEKEVKLLLGLNFFLPYIKKPLQFTCTGVFHFSLPGTIQFLNQ